MSCLVRLEHYLQKKWRVSHDYRSVIDIKTVGVLKEMVSFYHEAIIATTECERSPATAPAWLLFAWGLDGSRATSGTGMPCSVGLQPLEGNSMPWRAAGRCIVSIHIEVSR